MQGHVNPGKAGRSSVEKGKAMHALHMSKLVCKRCGHTWLPRIRAPVQCPKCKSPRWAIPK